jgi:quinol monooxygenase YgiN
LTAAEPDGMMPRVEDRRWTAAGLVRMSITVVVRRQARPGQAEALLALAQERLGMTPRRPDRRIQTQVLQSRADPHSLLWVSSWESEADYWVRMNAAGGFDRLNALSAAPADRFFFQQLALYENMGRLPVVVQCALIHTSPDASARVLDYLSEHSGPALKGLPGLLMRMVYQDRDEPSRLFTIHGWESVATFEQHQGEGHPHFQTQAHALGARVEYFMGFTRGYVDRYETSHNSPVQLPE